MFSKVFHLSDGSKAKIESYIMYKLCMYPKVDEDFSKTEFSIVFYGSYLPYCVVEIYMELQSEIRGQI